MPIDSGGLINATPLGMAGLSTVRIDIGRHAGQRLGVRPGHATLPTPLLVGRASAA